MIERGIKTFGRYTVQQAVDGRRDGGRALTLIQARAVLKAAGADRLNGYFVLSLLTGVRGEEARALTWDHVDLYGPAPYVAVLRPMRGADDAKAGRPRCTLLLPERAAEALRAHQNLQTLERARFESAGFAWRDSSLVFTTTRGSPLDTANVRRSLRRICKNAGIGENWTLRDLRNGFMSVISGRGVPLELIADLVT